MSGPSYRSLFAAFPGQVLVACLLIVTAVKAQAASLVVRVNDQHGQPLDRVVVTVTSSTIAQERREPGIHLMDQVDKRFVPDVIAINKGDYIRFPNSDDIRHHVYSFSVPLTFELPLYSGEPQEPVHFREPGMVTVGCNIHDQMVGYIYVVEGARHAVSKAGTASFENLPEETLTVTLQHPDAEKAPAGSFEVSAAALSAPLPVQVIELKAYASAPETEALSELERKFLQLRQHQH